MTPDFLSRNGSSVKPTLNLSLKRMGSVLALCESQRAPLCGSRKTQATATKPAGEHSMSLCKREDDRKSAEIINPKKFLHVKNARKWETHRKTNGNDPQGQIDAHASRHRTNFRLLIARVKGLKVIGNRTGIKCRSRILSQKEFRVIGIFHPATNK